MFFLSQCYGGQVTVCVSLKFLLQKTSKKEAQASGSKWRVTITASHYFNIYLISSEGKHETNLESTDRNFYFDILFWSQAMLTGNMQHPQKNTAVSKYSRGLRLQVYFETKT